MTVTVFLIRKPIKNKLIRDFLYYVPYVTLSVMTFPAIIDSTNSPIAGALALVVGIIAGYKNLGLFKITLLCCITVFLLELFI